MDERGRVRRPGMRDALIATSAGVTGMVLYDLFTDGFSWGSVVKWVLLWAVGFFALALFFYASRDRFGRDTYSRKR